jgi:hypothetical protein
MFQKFENGPINMDPKKNLKIKEKKKKKKSCECTHELIKYKSY